MQETKIKTLQKCLEQRKNHFYVPKRYIMTLLGFFGMFNVYAMRVNLSVAMVAMVNSTTESYENHTVYVTECAMLMPTKAESKNEYTGQQYNWDSTTQGLILGSFFYGYVLTQIPAGYFAERFGAKWLFGSGVLVTAVFSLLTPLAARWGVVAFVTVRIIEGLGEGLTYPAMNVMISNWSPKLERSRVSTFVYTGTQIGNVVAMPISGWLSGTDLLGGWPSVFYVFGTFGCIWFILWAIFIYETPAKHPNISKEELLYIQKDKDEIPQKKPKAPWKAIFTSVPVWALIVAHTGHHFGFLILLTELPSYLSSILHFDIKQNGSLSALPYIVQAISAWMASFIADKMRESNWLSITMIRKIFNSIGLFGPALGLFFVTLSGCRADVIVALISLSLALNGFVYSGVIVTHVDMSPNFAGTLFGITSGISNLCGIIGPAVVGAFTEGGATISNWSSVFYITVAVYTVSGVVYAIFASAELQPWDHGDKDSETPLKVITTIDAKS